MELRYLRSALEVARTGSMGQAAINLNLSPASLTRQIQTVERELGIQFFDRTGRGTYLSDSGRQLFDDCAELLRMYDVVRDNAERARGGRLGTLTIAATPQTIERLVAPFLGRFTRENPDVRCRVQEHGGAEVFKLVESGAVRIGVGVGGASDHLEQVHLTDMKLLAIRSRRRADAGRKDQTISLADVCREPVLSLKTPFGSRALFDDACRAEGLRPNRVFESSAPDAILAMVAGNQGIGVLPSTVDLRTAMSLTGVQIVSGTGERLSLPLVAAYDPSLSDPGYVAKAIQGMSTMAAQLAI